MSVAGNERVALKIAHISAAAVRALDAERAVLTALASREQSSSHVVRLIDHGRTDDGRPFLVLEWFDKTVGSWLQQGAPDLVERLRIAVLAGISIDWLHTRGGNAFEMMIHHDIKLNNLLLGVRSGMPRVVLADFGTARTGRADANVTVPAEVTPGAAAPEAFIRGAKRPLDPSIDVFSFAAAVFLLLTGRRLSSATRDERMPAALEATAAYDLVRLHDLRDLDSDARARFAAAQGAFDLEGALRAHSIHTFGEVDRDALIGAFLAFAQSRGGDPATARAAGTALWGWMAACLSPVPGPRPKSVRPLLGALKSAGEALGVDVDRALAAPVGVLRPGDRVERYVVDALLGDGGMGEVYRIRDEQLRIPLALKVVKAGPAGLRSRLLNEGSAQARLSHPGIVRCQSVVDVGGRPGLVLEYCDGGDLLQLLRGGPLAPGEVDRIGKELLEAVAYAHAEGVVHRDLKPANVLLHKRGGVLAVKVTDFGLVKELGGTPGLTRPGTGMGTAAYMAPEQAKDASSVGAVADVFSLGAILYELVTGRPAFLDEDLSDVFARANKSTYLPVATLAPDALTRHVVAIDAALMARPADRPQSVDELLGVWRGERGWSVVPAPSETIAPFDDDEPVPDEPIVPTPSRRGVWLLVALVALVVPALGLAGLGATWVALSATVEPAAEPVAAVSPPEPAPAPVDAEPPPAEEPPEPIIAVSAPVPPPAAPRPTPRPAAPPVEVVPDPEPEPAPEPVAQEPEPEPTPPLPAFVKVYLSPALDGSPSQATRVTVDGVALDAGKIALNRTDGAFKVTRDGATECDVTYALTASSGAWSVVIGGVTATSGVCCSKGRVHAGRCP